MDRYDRPVFGIGCNAVVINPEHEVLLLRRAEAEVHKPGIWDLPGGKLEVEEHPREGLKREIAEETALADVEVLCPLKVELMDKDYFPLKIVNIKYLVLAYSTEVMLSREHDAFCWTTLNALPSGLDADLIEVIALAFERCWLRWNSSAYR